jgi:hypothetical protein
MKYQMYQAMMYVLTRVIRKNRVIDTLQCKESDVNLIMSDYFVVIFLSASCIISWVTNLSGKCLLDDDKFETMTVYCLLLACYLGLGKFEIFIFLTAH